MRSSVRAVAAAVTLALLLASVAPVSAVDVASSSGAWPGGGGVCDLPGPARAL